LLPFGLFGGVVPTAAAEQLHANVDYWAPNDVRPREPVSVVLQLYVAGPSPNPREGRPVAGVNGVEVLLRGQGQTHRFATEDVGEGRYSAEIVFPEAGGWDLRVRYGAGDYGPGDEILLGKGGICVGAELCAAGHPAEAAPSSRRAGVSVALAVGIGAVVIALVLRRSARRRVSRRAAAARVARASRRRRGRRGESARAPSAAAAPGRPRTFAS
jgi:hypothetical protein